MKISGKVVVTYADERKEERLIAKGLEVTIDNRSMVTDCMRDYFRDNSIFK